MRQKAVKRSKKREERSEVKKSRSYLSRSKPLLKKKKRILIICEGENTEPTYFKNFRLSTAEIKVVGYGMSAVELIHKTLRMPDLKEYDEVWCVYDRDDRFDSFNRSLILAKENNINVAYSIQAFEYWIFLHFFDHDGGVMERKDCLKKINKYIKQFDCGLDGRSGKKVDIRLFYLMQRLDPLKGISPQQLAMHRARKIYDSYDHLNPAAEESSTTVFKLVEELLNHTSDSS